MYASSQELADFTGVLVQRQYKPGQKYIQLVFKTAEGLQLSLSRNLEMVRSLSVGNTYHVRGQQHTLGRKQYIHEPVAVPITVRPSFLRHHRRVLAATAVCLVIVSGSGTAFMLAHSPASPKPSASSANVAKPQIITVKPTVTPVAAAATQTTPTPPVVKSTKATTSKIVAKATTPAAGTTSTPQSASQSTAPTTPQAPAEDPPAQPETPPADPVVQTPPDPTPVDPVDPGSGGGTQ
jgi:hypothetical protein